MYKQNKKDLIHLKNSAKGRIKQSTKYLSFQAQESFSPNLSTKFSFFSFQILFLAITNVNFKKYNNGKKRTGFIF